MDLDKNPFTILQRLERHQTIRYCAWEILKKSGPMTEEALVAAIVAQNLRPIFPTSLRGTVELFMQLTKELGVDESHFQRLPTGWVIRREGSSRGRTDAAGPSGEARDNRTLKARATNNPYAKNQKEERPKTIRYCAWEVLKDSGPLSDEALRSAIVSRGLRISFPVALIGKELSLEEQLFERLPEGWILKQMANLKHAANSGEQRKTPKVKSPGGNPYAENQRDGRHKTIRYCAWEVLKNSGPLSEEAIAEAFESRELRPATPTNLIFKELCLDENQFERLDDGWVLVVDGKRKTVPISARPPADENPYAAYQRDGRPKTIRYAAWEVLKDSTAPMSEEEVAKAIEAKGLRPETPSNLIAKELNVDDEIFERLPAGWIAQREPKPNGGEKSKSKVKKRENPFIDLQRDGRPKTIRFAAWEVLKDSTAPMSEEELSKAMVAMGLRPETPSNLITKELNQARAHFQQLPGGCGWVFIPMDNKEDVETMGSYVRTRLGKRTSSPMEGQEESRVTRIKSTLQEKSGSRPWWVVQPKNGRKKEQKLTKAADSPIDMELDRPTRWRRGADASKPADNEPKAKAAVKKATNAGRGADAVPNSSLDDAAAAHTLKELANRYEKSTSPRSRDKAPALKEATLPKEGLEPNAAPPSVCAFDPALGPGTAWKPFVIPKRQQETQTQLERPLPVAAASVLRRTGAAELGWRWLSILSMMGGSTRNPLTSSKDKENPDVRDNRENEGMRSQEEGTKEGLGPRKVHSYSEAHEDTNAKTETPGEVLLHQNAGGMAQ